MAGNVNASKSTDRTTSSTSNRLWRYGPLIVWMILIFAGSTGALSASTSGRILRPVLGWLFPHMPEAQVATLHFFLRKLSHFSEYAILALLAARAFYSSTKEWLSFIDMAGGTTALLVTLWWHRRRRRRTVQAEVRP
jgi:VanZ family protein